MEYYGYAVLIRSDYLGEDSAHGRMLLTEALKAFSQLGNVPETIAFVGTGVRLPLSSDSGMINICRTFMVRGAQLLVCAESLDGLGLPRDTAVGRILPVGGIMEKLALAEKVITL